jgi:GxxExxY protein
MGRETALGAILDPMSRRALAEEALTHSVIGCFFEVYNILKFGLLESHYSRALEWELVGRGHHVARELAVRIGYKGIDLGLQRIDFVVDAKLVVEIKSTQELHKAAMRQVYSYLRASNLELGLLLHFGPDAKFYRVYVPNDPGRGR